MSKIQNHAPWPHDGFVRLSSILAPRGPLPISRSSWWAGVASGRYPKPGETRSAHHRMACARSGPADGRSVMTIQQRTRELRTIGKLTALLPSEALITSNIRYLIWYVGKMLCIELQSLLAAAPKP